MITRNPLSGQAGGAKPLAMVGKAVGVCAVVIAVVVLAKLPVDAGRAIVEPAVPLAYATTLPTSTSEAGSPAAPLSGQPVGYFPAGFASRARDIAPPIEQF